MHSLRDLIKFGEGPLTQAAVVIGQRRQCWAISKWMVTVGGELGTVRLTYGSAEIATVDWTHATRVRLTYKRMTLAATGHMTSACLSGWSSRGHVTSSAAYDWSILGHMTRTTFRSAKLIGRALQCISTQKSFSGHLVIAALTLIYLPQVSILHTEQRVG